MDSRDASSASGAGSTASPPPSQRRNSGSVTAAPQHHALTSTRGPNSNTARQDVDVDIDAHETIDDFIRPMLPPPLPPVERGSAKNRSGGGGYSNPNASASSLRPLTGGASPALRSASVNLDDPSLGPAESQNGDQQPPSSTARVSRPQSSNPRPPLAHTTSHHSAAPTTVSQSRMSRPSSAHPQSSSPVVAASKTSGKPPRATSTSRRSPSSRSGRGATSEHSTPEVEELMPLSIARTRPVERFFVETHEYTANREGENGGAGGQPRNENELLLEQFADYTDDDSFFSSGSTVIECEPGRMANNPIRGRAIKSVHETLQLRQLTNGRVPEDAAWNAAQKESWLYQIHYRALALQSSSFFIFPARWTPRVVVYNVMHHWVFELCLFFIILGYSIFQASWGRYTAPKEAMSKPDFALWADVFYTVLYGLEIVFRLFASGFILHKRAFFRSPWHWLDTAVLVMAILECTWWQQVWNFTPWRLIRCIKCLTYVPAPVRMKLLAKSLLRSTNKLLQSSFILVYFVFFFGLLGLQLFVGELHSRCVNDLTGEVTDQICRPVATGQYWFYWGHYCGTIYTCVSDAFPNPHYDFRSFDDIGHAMLSTFQIMTFQGWTSLMNETNDGLAVMAFLYYAFTIVLCTWVVPSLFLGVFIEKIERTSRLFVLKQLDLFDCMLQEQKQRMSATVRLHDYVQRDADGRITHYPAYNAKQLTSTDEESSSSSNGRRGDEARHVGTRSIHRTHWTDEQRLQLQLSLTRQRDIAEEGERKRVTRPNNGSSNRRSSVHKLNGEGAALSRASSTRRTASSRGGGGAAAGRGATTTTATSSSAVGTSDFALGGRIGTVQHHPSACAIGASRRSDLPFAARQEMETVRLRFLDPYASASQLPLALAAAEYGGGAATSASGVSQSQLRQPLAANSTVLAARESVGVVPNRHAMSVTGSMARINSMSRVAGAESVQGGAGAGAGGISVAPSRLHASTIGVPQEPYVVHDPEGGDFRYAKTCGDKVAIIRNIVHMFTEGYPRILTQYLWEHKMMQYRYGLMPLSYTNRYEEAALNKLRKRRARERAAEREEMRLHGMAPMLDDDDDDDLERLSNTNGSVRETRWMREEGLIAGSLSPIRMAENIKENAPVTLFQGIMYFFILANAVFNASRFDTMPDYWEMGTFVAGVCFSALFTLELLMRLFALGPGPFLLDLFNLIETTFVVISLFQLGFSRANTISLFNWVRFLKMLRVMPIRPMRRVARVLIHAFPDMLYALVFFSIYMLMWVLLGMSFFGSRFGWIDYNTSNYYTRGNFETFSQAAMAVAQAFSVNRDEWLYMSWSGMRVRGSYTVMYFIGTVFIAFLFRFFFIAVMTWAWQSQEEREEYVANSLAAEAASRRTGLRFARLPWFDFTVWRSFKHIHGGFERRDVAPDEVYCLNEDMRCQLRIAESKDRALKEAHERALLRQHGLLDENDEYNYDYVGPYRYGEDGDPDTYDGPSLGPQYINVGGQLYRQQSLPHVAGGDISGVGSGGGSGGRVLNPATLQRQYPAYPATGLAAAAPTLSTSHLMDEHSRSIVNPLLGSRHSLSPARTTRHTSTAPSMRGGDPVDGEGNPSVSAQLLRLGRASDVDGNHTVHEAGGALAEEGCYQHLLLPGPRLRYKSVMADGHRVFDKCLDCNTYKQMPLRAPPGVAQRTATELHAEHCHMSAVRSSRQLVLNALLGYARMQAEHEVTPTKRMIETLLGQAWSCGMLLFETIENLSCLDLEEEDRDWGRVLRALEMQQWILGLHVGEEQVGRATLAYVLAHQQKQEEVVREVQYKESWQDYSFFALSPSNPVRRGVSHVTDSWWFEAIILCVIFAASICLAVYAPGDNSRDMGGSYNSGKYKALHILDDIFTVIFTVEMVLKWISMGVLLPVGRAYFWHLWNIFDCFIVLISLVSWGKDDIFLRCLKVMRCFRILGPLRYWRCNGSMANIARAIWDSIPTLANVCLLMLMHYIVWAIIFVSMFMNKMNFCSNSSIVNRTECLEVSGNTWQPAQRNFRNFYESLLTTFEISTGAEWLDVMYDGVDSWSTQFSPRFNRHPYLGLVLIVYYYLAHFVLFTLFIASLIYCYMVAKSAMEGALAAGTSLEHQLWLRMQNMVMQIRPKPRLLPLGNPASRLFHVIVINKWFEAFMGLILTFNMVTMALQWYHMSHTQQLTLDIFQWVFVGIFTVEVLLRLIAHGPRFFTRWAYCWDLLIICLSYIQIGLNTTANNRMPFNVNVLRMLRLGRFLNLVNLVTPFHTHLTLFAEVLRTSVPGIVNVSLLYLLSVYVFAILGLHLLGCIAPYGGYIDNTYNNFSTFVNALVMVFRLSTLENWATMLRGSLDRGDYCGRESSRCGPTDWAPVYYIPIVLCFFLMMSTLYLAVIVDNYVAAVRMHSSVRRLHDLRRFCTLWQQRDPNNTLVLSVPQLLELLEELRLPLGVSDRRNRTELLGLLRDYDIPDHGGYVYYYEVLLPLARRVMAISFSEENAAEGAGLNSGGASWRVSEGSLGALAASPYARDADFGGHTVAEYFAATYLQAAYRRDRAMRRYYLLRSAQWHKGRAACDRQGVSYTDYGFGSCGLAYPDPREDGERRGFALPSGATVDSHPTYADPINTRIAKRGAEERRHRRAEAGEDGDEATLLPSIYRSAITVPERRFGPDAPGAIRRHERRSDKLQRRREAEANERAAFEDEAARQQVADDRAALEALVEDRTGGVSQPTSQAGGGMGRSLASAVQPSLRRSMHSLYDTNPNNASYQPPLGTSPEQLRADEQARRQQQQQSQLRPSSSAANVQDSYANNSETECQ